MKGWRKPSRKGLKRKTLSCGLGWRVLPVWVCWLWPVRMGPDGFPSLVICWRVW